MVSVSKVRSRAVLAWRWVRDFMTRREMRKEWGGKPHGFRISRRIVRVRKHETIRKPVLTPESHKGFSVKSPKPRRACMAVGEGLYDTPGNEERPFSQR